MPIRTALVAALIASLSSFAAEADDARKRARFRPGASKTAPAKSTTIRPHVKPKPGKRIGAAAFKIPAKGVKLLRTKQLTITADKPVVPGIYVVHHGLYNSGRYYRGFWANEESDYTTFYMNAGWAALGAIRVDCSGGFKNASFTVSFGTYYNYNGEELGAADIGSLDGSTLTFTVPKSKLPGRGLMWVKIQGNKGTRNWAIGKCTFTRT